MTITPAAIPSVPSLDVCGDVAVHVTFCPGDPIGLTEVIINPDPGEHARLLDMIEATIERLAAYYADYSAAQADDTAPLPLPVPWYGWGR